MPRVSIGLPVYNGEKYLANAIESILGQSYEDLELIVADNASGDATFEICHDYSTRDKRVRYVRNATNLGAAPNFNRTVELAGGEYFKWAAHDDVIAENYLATCVEALDQTPSIVLCQTAATIIDEYGGTKGVIFYDADVGAPQPQHRFRNIALVRANTALPVFGVIRSAVLKRTNLIGSYPSSDIVFLAELSLYGRFLQLPDPLFFWRVHDRQSTKGELVVERNRVSWFDTAAAEKITMPKWQYLQGYLRAISKAPITVGQRASCYASVGRWVLVPAHLRALGKDMLLAVRRLTANGDIHRKLRGG